LEVLCPLPPCSSRACMECDCPKTPAISAIAEALSANAGIWACLSQGNPHRRSPHPLFVSLNKPWLACAYLQLLVVQLQPGPADRTPTSPSAPLPHPSAAPRGAAIFLLRGRTRLMPCQLIQCSNGIPKLVPQDWRMHNPALERWVLGSRGHAAPCFFEACDLPCLRMVPE
jgi:hypothetical protein